MSIQALQQLRDSLGQLFKRDVQRQAEIEEMRKDIERLSERINRQQQSRPQPK